eukprot:ANDGO_05825.mRNA.1 Ammonium transporter 1
MYENCAPGGFNHGDIAYMAFATTVVFLMTPAMGLAQAGFLRRKNSLTMLMQVMSGCTIGSLLWFLLGFTMTFGDSVGGFIGNLDWALMINLPFDDCVPHLSANTIPSTIFALYQCMFAIGTPLIVSGAWAEKIEYKAYIIFIVMFPIFVYYPLAHWIWNSGGWLFQMGLMDFSGGLVIHASAGISGFVMASVLQRRLHHKKLIQSQIHHNLPISVLGGALIWAGWMSFNAGSAYAANFQATTAVFNTHMAACSAGLAVTILAYLEDGHWHLTEIINGTLAGCATMTPGSGYVKPWASLIYGTVGGSSAFFTARLVKRRWGIDDVLDVTALQGIPGTVGALLTAFFACSEVSTVDPDDVGPNGIFYGGEAKVFGVQLLGSVVTWGWAAFVTYLISIVISKTVGLDVSPEVEEMGLDKAQIGESAYDQELHMLLDLGADTLTIKLCEAAAAGDLGEVKNLCSHGADPSRGDFDGRTPLHLAACENQLVVARYLLDNYRGVVDVNAIDKFGRTPLEDALSHGREEIARFLGDRGGRVHDPSCFTPLICMAAAHGRYDEIERIVRLGGMDVKVNSDYDKRTPLMIAASEGYADIVKLLLQYGADPRQTDRFGGTAFSDATLFNHPEVAQLLQLALDGQLDQVPPETNTLSSRRASKKGASSDSDPFARLSSISSSASCVSLLSGTVPPLSSSGLASATDSRRAVLTASVRESCAAASSGDISELKRIVKKGGDPSLGNYDGRTPLHLAAAGGHYAVVQFLLSPVCREVNVNAMDRWKQTPLAEAIRHDNLAIAQLLRQHGATIIHAELGYCLCSAASKGDIAELQMMLATGADLNASDYDGRTAMHLAAAEAQQDTMVWLLKHGADAFPKDRYGMTPLDDAKRYGNKKMIRVLKEYASQLERQVMHNQTGVTLSSDVGSDDVMPADQQPNAVRFRGGSSASPESLV